MDKPLLDFGRARMVKGKGFSIRLPGVERLRIARGYKQAVVKVASYAHGRARVQGLVDYISRKGKLELETESGERIRDREDAKALVTNWARDFDNAERSRDAVHLIFSMPPGSKVEALRNSIRKVGATAFPDQEWAFAIHQDRNHPHAHMAVKMRGKEKDQKLRLNKPELCKLREVFAEAAREEGVMLAASPRAARGVGQKAKRQAIYQMRQKGIVPDVEKQTARELLADLEQGPLQEKPWEKAMRERNEQERKAFREEAEKLRKKAADPKMEAGQRKRQTMLQVATILERYAQNMPKPRSQRQAMVEKAKTKTPEKTKIKSRESGMELDI